MHFKIDLDLNTNSYIITMPSLSYEKNKQYAQKYNAKNADKIRLLNRNNKRKFDTYNRIRFIFLNILLD